VPAMCRPVCRNGSRHGTFLAFSLWKRMRVGSFPKGN
jgi:hypothetical protein